MDVAGLVRGASKGEGLGNQFLANIRACDAVVQVSTSVGWRSKAASWNRGCICRRSPSCTAFPAVISLLRQLAVQAQPVWPHGSFTAPDGCILTHNCYVCLTEDITGYGYGSESRRAATPAPENSLLSTQCKSAVQKQQEFPLPTSCLTSKGVHLTLQALLLSKPALAAGLRCHALTCSHTMCFRCSALPLH